MPGTLEIETINIPFEASMKIGWRQQGNQTWNYLSNYPTANDIPYSWTVPTSGIPYEVEITVICPNCSGGQFSTPVVTTAIST